MGKKILIVDDSATIRQQVNFVLGRQGHQIIEAVDGKDGLDKVTKNPDIAAIVLDQNMPQMTGIEMIIEVKKNPSVAHIPIIILTTESKGQLIESAKAAGASGWLVKPFVPDLLVGAVNKVLGAK